MSNTIVYSDYNGYPGLNTATSKSYDYFSGYSLPILPDVNLYKSFNYLLSATTANSVVTPTVVDPNKTSWWSDPNGYKSGVATQSQEYGYAGTDIIKIVTGIEWVRNGGPNGDGICFNEKGDWFNEATLGQADSEGSGVKFTNVNYPGQTIPFTHLTRTNNFNRLFTINISKPNDLRIAGAYNGAVFCYNKFEYTNDDQGTIYTAKSLYELPEKFDNLVSFIPDQRESTTLTFTVRVSWQRYVGWGIWDALLSTSKKNEILNNYTNNGFGSSGVDTHIIKHVVKNTNPNWAKILREILRDRQRSLEEQDARYGQTFPKQEIKLSLPEKVPQSLNVPVSGATIPNSDGSTTTFATNCSVTSIVNTTASGVINRSTIFTDGTNTNVT